MTKKWYSTNDKIIRDNIHGDVLLEEKFVKIITTPEFQRLRRIKQLSVANMIFPGADHTRLSHSIGTFHVMRKIVVHIKKQLSNINVTIEERDENLILVAALLHDIGHGPFSHAFEKVQKSSGKSHEQWTTDIIEHSKGGLNFVLKSQFDDTFPDDVASLITKSSSRNLEHNYFDKIDFTQILSSLISSQLDADRLDYLLRDSTLTGVTFGKIDVDRIIASIRVTEHDDKYCLCFQEKYISDLESYLLARLQMNKSVYFHSFKIEMESIIEYIISRAKYLYKEKKLRVVPDNLISFFNDKITVEDYLGLDDTIFTAAIISWKDESDEIISSLCCCFIDRVKFTKLNILTNSLDDINTFKQELGLLYKDSTGKSLEFDAGYFWIQEEAKYAMYNTKKENIKILCKNGEVKDISEVSHIFKIGESKIYDENYILCFINVNLITKDPSLRQKINALIETYDIKSHIEIERKYAFPLDLRIDDIYDFLKSTDNMSIGELSHGVQTDVYYDTHEFILAENKESLRIRNINGKLCLTIKAKFKSEGSTVLNDQHERIEYEEMIQSPDISNNLEFIKRKLKSNIEQGLNEVATIKNCRSKALIKYNKAEFEIAFDDFEIVHNKKVLGTERQIEVELKSDFATKIQLKQFSDILVQKFPLLKQVSLSKLEIAMSYRK